MILTFRQQIDLSRDFLSKNHLKFQNRNIIWSCGIRGGILVRFIKGDFFSNIFFNSINDKMVKDIWPKNPKTAFDIEDVLILVEVIHRNNKMD